MQVNSTGQLQSEFDFGKSKRKECICPHCGHKSIEYLRKLNSNMAYTLLSLYRHKVFSFVHVEKFLKEHGYPRSGDFHKLVHWGFIEKKSGEKEDGNPDNGFYKITGRGIMFAESKATAKEIALIMDNEFKGFAGRDIDIKDALGTKFNYNELMDNI